MYEDHVIQASSRNQLCQEVSTQLPFKRKRHSQKETLSSIPESYKTTYKLLVCSTTLEKHKLQLNVEITDKETEKDKISMNFSWLCEDARKSDNLWFCYKGERNHFLN